MAIIPQQRLFGWEKIEKLGDLERLRLVVEYMPDEDLMRKLEEIRNNGRDDYPVRATWNSVLAGVVFQHPSVEHLRRELDRNGQLRYMCGLDSVPTSSAYSRFLYSLLQNPEDVDAIFYKLVDEIKEVLPDFGKILAIDGKAIQTHVGYPSTNCVCTYPCFNSESGMSNDHKEHKHQQYEDP
jgi:hypothetical protein